MSEQSSTLNALKRWTGRSVLVVTVIVAYVVGRMYQGPEPSDSYQVTPEDAGKGTVQLIKAMYDQWDVSSDNRTGLVMLPSKATVTFYIGATTNGSLTITGSQVAAGGRIQQSTGKQSQNTIVVEFEHLAALLLENDPAISREHLKMLFGVDAPYLHSVADEPNGDAQAPFAFASMKDINTGKTFSIGRSEDRRIIYVPSNFDPKQADWDQIQLLAGFNPRAIDWGQVDIKQSPSIDLLLYDTAREDVDRLHLSDSPVILGKPENLTNGERLHIEHIQNALENRSPSSDENQLILELFRRNPDLNERLLENFSGQ